MADTNIIDTAVEAYREEIKSTLVVPLNETLEQLKENDPAQFAVKYTELLDQAVEERVQAYRTAITPKQEETGTPATPTNAGEDADQGKEQEVSKEKVDETTPQVGVPSDIDWNGVPTEDIPLTDEAIKDIAREAGVSPDSVDTFSYI